MNVNDIKTPAYVCELSKLQANLKVLSDVGVRSGAHVLCALKGFAFSLAMPYVARFLSGATCSGLWEAKYANEFFRANLDDEFQNPACENLNLNLDENLSNSKTNSVQISSKKCASNLALNLDKNSSQNVRNLGAQAGKKFAQEQISSQNNVNFLSIFATLFSLTGRGDQTRTDGLAVPNRARYQLRHTPISSMLAKYRHCVYCIYNIVSIGRHFTLIVVVFTPKYNEKLHKTSLIN